VICCLPVPEALLAQQAHIPAAQWSKADSVAARYPAHAIKDLKVLSEKLTLPLKTDVEKFRAIYTWVCSNIAYDYVLFKINQRQTSKLKNDPAALEAWQRPFSRRMFRVLVRQHRTVCTGYAYLLRDLAHIAGIRCVVVHGYGRSAQTNVRGAGVVNHSWNAVQLDGRWYLCDATWSSGSIDTSRGIFIKEFDDTYFLVDPALFARNHYPLDTADLHLREKPSLHDFLYAPIVYRSAFRYKAMPLARSTFDIDVVKGEPVMFEFSKDKATVIDRVTVRRGISSGDVTVVRVDDTDDRYCFDYTFHARGRQVVHVLIDDQYAWTYTVQVR
jgi:transglutaminase/protease-like cytokinesis protein 3